MGVLKNRDESVAIFCCTKLEQTMSTTSTAILKSKVLKASCEFSDIHFDFTGGHMSPYWQILSQLFCRFLPTFPNNSEKIPLESLYKDQRKMGVVSS